MTVYLGNFNKFSRENLFKSVIVEKNEAKLIIKVYRNLFLYTIGVKNRYLNSIKGCSETFSDWLMRILLIMDALKNEQC